MLLKQARQNKLSTLYDPHPFTVLEHRGPSLILQREDGPMFMRNVSHVHKLHKDSRILFQTEILCLFCERHVE